MTITQQGLSSTCVAVPFLKAPPLTGSNKAEVAVRVPERRADLYRPYQFVMSMPFAGTPSSAISSLTLQHSFQVGVASNLTLQMVMPAATDWLEFYLPATFVSPSRSLSWAQGRCWAIPEFSMVMCKPTVALSGAATVTISLLQLGRYEFTGPAQTISIMALSSGKRKAISQANVIMDLAPFDKVVLRTVSCLNEGMHSYRCRWLLQSSLPFSFTNFYLKFQGVSPTAPCTLSRNDSVLKANTTIIQNSTIYVAAALPLSDQQEYWIDVGGLYVQPAAAA